MSELDSHIEGRVKVLALVGDVVGDVVGSVDGVIGGGAVERSIGWGGPQEERSRMTLLRGTRFQTELLT